MKKISRSRVLPNVSKDHAADYGSVADRLSRQVPMSTPEEEAQRTPSPWSNNAKE